MEIRKASVQDLGQIMQVYDKARKFMRENGNAEQWGEDYPSAELIEHDIDKMYLCMSEGRIACVFYYAAGHPFCGRLRMGCGRSSNRNCDRTELLRCLLFPDFTQN